MAAPWENDPIAAPTAPWEKDAVVEDKSGILNSIDAFGRGAADMATFGFADEMGAGARWLGGKVLPWQSNVSYDEALKEVRGEDKAVADAHPVSSVAGSVAGALALPLPAAKTTMGAIGQGAALGGAYGFGSGEGGVENRLENLGYGAAAGGVAGGIGHKVANAFATRAARASLPTQEAIVDAGNAAYRAAEDAGVIFTPKAAETLRGRVVDKLADMGYDPALQPGAAAVVRRLEELQGQNFTLKGLDTIRKVASNGYMPMTQTGAKSNNKAVTQIINMIDDLVDNPAADDILTGNAELGSQAISAARDFWSRQAKAERVQSAIRMAEDRASTTGSGANIDNAIRQNLNKIMKSPRGFSQAEQDLLRTAARGTPARNALRLAGKFAPTGVISSVLSGGAGYGLAGPAGLLLPVAGAGAKAASDALTKKSAQELVEVLLSGQTAKEVGRLAQKGIGPDALVAAMENIRAVEGVASPAMAKIAALLANSVRP